MPFGQIVIGPPGSGKVRQEKKRSEESIASASSNLAARSLAGQCRRELRNSKLSTPLLFLSVSPPLTKPKTQTTYCNGMHHFLTLAGRRPLLVNLDPAAEDSSLPLTPEVDVRDLVCLEGVMREHSLGPNGGLAYCMAYVAENADWLQGKLREALAKDANRFLIIDTPGQAELFSPGPHGAPLLSLLSSLAKEPPHISLASVLLLDSHLCTDGGKYLAGLLTALGSMLHLELPQVNVLSKIDNLRAYRNQGNARGNKQDSALQFDIAHYASATGLRYLVQDLTTGGGRGSGGSGAAAAAAAAASGASNDGGDGDNGGEKRQPPLPPTLTFASRYAKLTAGLCDVIEDFNLLSFTPLAIEDEECVRRVATLVDRAVGWVPEGVPSSSSSDVPSPAPAVVRFAAADRGGEALLEHVREKYLGGGGGGGGDGGGDNGEDEDEDEDEFFDDDR